MMQGTLESSRHKLKDQIISVWLVFDFVDGFIFINKELTFTAY